MVSMNTGDGDTWEGGQEWETAGGTQESGALPLQQSQRSALPGQSILASAKVRQCRGSFWGALQVSPSPSYLYAEPSRFGLLVF